MPDYGYAQADDEPEDVVEVVDENYWTDMAEFISGQQGNEN